MHAKRMLHNLLSPVMHLKRLSTLSLLVQAALTDKRLSVTKLGRALDLPIHERSCIRRADRFVSNIGLQREREDIYGAVVNQIVGNKKRPWIIVDWSPVPNVEKHVIRAALVADGRALTLYEEVHPEAQLANAKVHAAFLKQLKQLLAIDCKPIIVTDAGFYNSWFKQVLKQAWDYIGRIRGGVHYQLEGKEEWEAVKQLHALATNKARLIGQIKLSKTTPLECMLCLFHKKNKGRIDKTAKGKRRQSSSSRIQAKSAKEPWVLATSLSGQNVAKKAVKIYQYRMQIEESFRDLKASKYGFGFDQARSKNKERIQILLLIAMIASLVAWITGLVAESKKLQYQFQANSIKEKRVLSLFFLGCQVIKRKIKISMAEIKEALHEHGKFEHEWA